MTPVDTEIGIIGLDSSHAIEFTRRMQAPNCPASQKVEGIKAVSCLRFATPFQSEEGIDKRQEQLEEWGVRVTTDFDEAVSNCDAIMIEINDPSLHLEYFTRCADLGKPIFLDKPLADNTRNGRDICRIAREKNLKVFSSSSLRYAVELLDACNAVPEPHFATVYGAMGKAPAGSSVIWYGVHAFEMLQRAMGRGATGVFARRDTAGVVAVVDYPDGRRGIVELTEGFWLFGGCLRTSDKAVPFVVDNSKIYWLLLLEIAKFFREGESPLDLADTLEVMAMLDAADRSVQSGKPEAVETGDL